MDFDCDLFAQPSSGEYFANGAVAKLGAKPYVIKMDYQRGLGTLERCSMVTRCAVGLGLVGRFSVA